MATLRKFIKKNLKTKEDINKIKNYLIFKIYIWRIWCWNSNSLCRRLWNNGEQQFSQDLMGLIALFSGKLYGKRNHKNKKEVENGN